MSYVCSLAVVWLLCIFMIALLASLLSSSSFGMERIVTLILVLAEFCRRFNEWEIDTDVCSVLFGEGPAIFHSNCEIEIAVHRPWLHF